MKSKHYKITLLPSGREFEVPPGTSILGAAIHAGLSVPYSCKTGICRSCRGRVREGTISHASVDAEYLSEADQAAGYALLCQATPESDCTIEVAELDEMTTIRPRVVPCRVQKIKQLAPDVVGLQLRLPMNEKMRFQAGQYIDILLPEGKRRSYSIATDPGVEGVIELELHLRHTPGGLFTEHVFKTMKERELLRFEGPLGTFYLRENSDKPMVMLASGTGMAPIKAIMDYALRKQIHHVRPISVYWGGRTRADLYLLEQVADWAQQHANVTVVPVLSEPTPACAWTGRTGLVHHAVMTDFPDLANAQVYACGAPVMVEAARRDFVQQCALPAEEFIADSFVTEADRRRHAHPD